MKKRLLTKGFEGLLLALLLLFTLTSAADAQQKSQPQAKQIELKFATLRGPTDPNALRWQIPLMQEIEKQTGGKVKITPFWSEALGKASEQFNLVKSGVADMTDFPGSYTPGKFLVGEIGNLPFAAKDPANIRKAMAKLLDKGYFKASWGEVEVLGWNNTTFYEILFRKDKPLTFEALAGKKIRTPGGYMTEFLKAINAVPVNIPIADAYQSWERGMVEGWMHPMGAFYNFKLSDFSNKSLLKLDPMIMANACLIINKEKWASLDKDTQRIIRKIASDYEDVYAKANEYADGLALKVMNEKGVEVYTLPAPEMDKLKKAASSVWKKYIADVDRTGADGKAIVAEYIAILKGFGEDPIYRP
jgi:TRAP-type transport system periplasmic protein